MVDSGFALRGFDLRFVESVVGYETVGVEGAPIGEVFVLARFDDAGADDVVYGAGGLGGTDDVCSMLGFGAERVARGRVEEDTSDVADGEGGAEGWFVREGAAMQIHA